MLLMAPILMITTVLCFMVNSWITIWIMLELNTLSYCSIIKTVKKSKKKMAENSMKYFIIQSISSSILLMSITYMKMSFKFTTMLMMMSNVSILVKMAAAPFQQWFVKMASEIEWKSSTILMTWQKMAPVYLTIFMYKTMLMPFIMMTALLGSILQINKNIIMKIMGLSSVFNLSWMMMSIMNSMKTLITFSLLYWMSVAMMMMMISSSKMKKISKESISKMKKIIFFMMIMNLAGIPPLPSFMAKIMVLNEYMMTEMKLITSFVLITSSINMYIYMRMTNMELMKNPEKKQMQKSQTKNNMLNIIMLMMTLPLMMWYILGYAWTKGLFW